MCKTEREGLGGGTYFFSQFKQTHKITWRMKSLKNNFLNKYSLHKNIGVMGHSLDSLKIAEIINNKNYWDMKTTIYGLYKQVSLWFPLKKYGRFLNSKDKKI